MAKGSASGNDTKLHAHWDKVVSAAYLRILGHTQKEAAEAVGRSDRTLREWEADEHLWSAARSEARSRWLNDAEDAARRAVLNSLKLGNADLGKWMLERVDTTFAPPKQRVESTGYTFNPADFSREGLKRVAAGESPQHVLATGGGRGDG